MFVILVSYKKPLNEVDAYLEVHRAYLDEGYKLDYLLASGPRNPRTGGVLISPLSDKNILEKYLAQDPFSLQGISEYEIIDFIPVKYHPALTHLLNKKD